MAVNPSKIIRAIEKKAPLDKVIKVLFDGKVYNLLAVMNN
jgi:hypothetical protein